jgi:hypothetical protein
LVNQNTDVVTTKLKELVQRKGRLFFFLEGGWLFVVRESWDGEEEGEIGKERVNRFVIY